MKRDQSPASRRGTTKLVTPIPFPESLSITAPKRTLTAVGETTQLTVTSNQLGGGTLDVTSSAQWTTYRTSNPGIISVNRAGLCPAVAALTVFTTATNEGVFSVFQVDVAIGDPLSKVTGTVGYPGGNPAAGASVTASTEPAGFP